MFVIPVVITLITLGQAEASEESLKAMSQRAQDCRVTLQNESKAKPQLVAKPVFRYADEVRHIEDAGIWVWTQSGRPAAMMKVEHYKAGVLRTQWLYCFASLSSELLSAEWDGNPTFESRKPGVTWKPLDDKPSTTRAGRLVQMREIARRFSSEMQEPNGEAFQMRLLPQPLYRYDEGLTSAEDGAIFGFTGTGTNPDLLVLLELTKDGTWQFGLAGMTVAKMTVRLKDNVVSEIRSTSGKGFVFDTWTYFLPAEVRASESTQKK